MLLGDSSGAFFSRDTNLAPLLELGYGGVQAMQPEGGETQQCCFPPISCVPKCCLGGDDRKVRKCRGMAVRKPRGCFYGAKVTSNQPHQRAFPAMEGWWASSHHQIKLYTCNFHCNSCIDFTAEAGAVFLPRSWVRGGWSTGCSATVQTEPLKATAC